MKLRLGSAAVLAIALGVPLTNAATVQQHFTPAPRVLVPEELRLDPAAPLDRMEQTLRQRLADDDRDARAHHALGSVLFAAGRPSEAATAWDTAHDLDPAFAPSRVMAAIRPVFDAQEKGDPSAAALALTKAERELGDDPHFLMIRGEQAMRGGNLAAALAAYRGAHDAAPDLYATALNLARALEQAGDAEAAESLFDIAIRLAPDRPGPRDHLAQFQYRRGQADAALALLLEAEALDDRQPLAEIRLAELSVQARDLPAARHWYRFALKRAESGHDAILVALGDVEMRLDLVEAARDTLDAVLSRTRPAPVLVARGYVAERLGDLDGAIRLYREAVVADPGNLPASNNLAMALIKADRNPEEARAHAAYAAERLPDNAAIHGTHALALWHAGALDEAQPVLASAVRVDPLDPWLRLAYGQALAAGGMADAARLQGEACLMLDRGFPRREACEALIGPR